MPLPSPTPETFWARVDRSDTTGCWLWLGPVNRKGYGAVYFWGGTQSAHRVAYTLAVGPIPAGMQLDHLCRVRACVNPAHLELVTGLENTRRGMKGVLRTRCAQGHELTPENTYTQHGRRRDCRICIRARLLRFRARSAA
jgi:hypothetical protein